MLVINYLYISLLFCSALFGGLSNPLSLGIFVVISGLCISFLAIKARLKAAPIILLTLALSLGAFSSGAKILPAKANPFAI